MASLIQNFLNAPDYLEYSPWFPNPLIVMRDLVRTTTNEGIARLPWNGVGTWMKETWDWMTVSITLDWTVVVYPILIAILMTVVRVIANHLVLNVRTMCIILEGVRLPWKLE